MVKHIVIYQLREDCDKQAAVQEISQALESLVGVIPGLQWLEVCPTYQGDADYGSYLLDRSQYPACASPFLQ